MKKLLFAFLLIVPMASAFADNETPAEDPCAGGQCFISSTYMTGAYNALDSAKQAKLTANHIKSATGSSEGTGAVVTSITASNGEITVSRSNVQIPYGSSSATNYATIWVE